MNIWAISCDPSTTHLLNVACREEGHTLRSLDSATETSSGDSPALIFIEAAGLEPTLVSRLTELLRAHPRCFIALVTGNALGAESIPQLGSLGINAYVTKPPTLSDLAGIIRKARS